MLPQGDRSRPARTGPRQGAPRSPALPRHLPPGPAWPKPARLAFQYDRLLPKSWLQRLTPQAPGSYQFRSKPPALDGPATGPDKCKTWSARWRLRSQAWQTACGRTSWPWWWTTPSNRVTHIVRGEDLADNTPRQILLQKALGLPTPAYLHTPLVLDVNGGKTLQTKRRGCSGPVQPAHGVEPGSAGSGFTRSGEIHTTFRCPMRLRTGFRLGHESTMTHRDRPEQYFPQRRAFRCATSRWRCTRWRGISQNHQELCTARRPHHHRAGQGL